jgi:hypothetical protein
VAQAPLKTSKSLFSDFESCAQEKISPLNLRFAGPRCTNSPHVRQGVIQATTKAIDGKASANKVGGKGTINYRGVCSSQTKNALIGYQVQSIETNEEGMDYY